MGGSNALNHALREWIGARVAGLGFNAQVTEWLMVADCKSAALRRYGGSNPPLCTRLFLS